MELQELKRKMLLCINTKEDMPIEVMNIINRAFEELSYIYKSSNTLYLPTSEYIDGTLAMLKSQLINSIGRNRKDAQIQKILIICNQIERELNETQSRTQGANSELEEEIKTENERRHKSDLSQIKEDNTQTAINITQLLEDSLKNIQSRQNRILDSRGYNMNTIQNINNNAISTIRAFVNSQGKEICTILDNQDNGTEKQLLQLYEQYLLENQHDKNRQTNLSKEEQFRESLNANISLEEQHDYAIEIQKKQEMQPQEDREEQPGILPGDIFD